MIVWQENKEYNEIKNSHDFVIGLPQRYYYTSTSYKYK